MKLRGQILLGLLFSTNLLNAQTDYRPGYIISTNGDTLFGKIDYRGDLLMSSLCKFKGADNGIKHYSPNDIVAFRFIDSKYYVSREINHKRVFLEYLIKGKVNIYYMRDDIGDHYYIDKENVKLTEIPYNEGIKYVDNRQVYFETTKHIGLLNYYMQDAPEFQSRKQTIKKPDHQNLIELAEDYHNAVCKGEKCVIYEKALPLIKISITPFVGLTKYNGYDKFIMESGGYLSIWAPRANEKLFLKTGLAYQNFPEDRENLNGYKIPFQFQYIYRVHRIQPNISAGVSLLLLKLYDKKFLGHTLNLNAGLDYNLSNRMNLTTAFNSDFTPMGLVIMDEYAKFDMISYSIIIGLRIDL